MNYCRIHVVPNGESFGCVCVYSALALAATYKDGGGRLYFENDGVVKSVVGFVLLAATLSVWAILVIGIPH